MTNNEMIQEMFDAYMRENSRFTVNKVKSAAPKARKALQELTKACKARRAEIMDEKKAMDNETNG
jgi:hypothetical protein